jgi:hypothetical protein
MMNFIFKAYIECATCDNTSDYSEDGEPIDFDWFDTGEFENSAIEHFNEKGFFREDALSGWKCAACIDAEVKA